MNKPVTTKSCGEFELLISGLIDVELSIAEQSRLTEHLVDCPDCRLRHENFVLVNDWVGRLGGCDDQTNGPIANGEHIEMVRPVNKLAGKIDRKHRFKWKRKTLTFAVLATAAAVVIVVSTTGFWAAAKPRKDIVGPFVSLSNINSERLRDQDFMCESLEYDLRTLKLQLYALNDLDEDSNSKEVLSRINRLMEKIDQAKIN